MPRGKKLTEEQISEIKEIKSQYPELQNEHVGKIVGVSGVTVGKVMDGFYDPKPEPEPKGEDDVALLLMEQNDKLDEIIKLLKSTMLAVAVVIDPNSGKTSAPVAENIRKAVRGD